VERETGIEPATFSLGSGAPTFIIPCYMHDLWQYNLVCVRLCVLFTCTLLRPVAQFRWRLKWRTEA
jgi:hypothetical protein